MSKPGLRLRHLSFHGPDRLPATVEFGPGLNVIYGASETGKSFVVEAIDFMLGGKPPLRGIEQRDGYDRILLGAETISGEQFTLQRSMEGGAFRMYPGLHLTPPADTNESRELADQHSDKSPNNLSTFLLERCELSGKRVRRNKLGDTNSLSFRNLARLLIVTETEITEQRSPLSDGNPTADTPNFATFKLLLTGVDDGALTTTKPKGAEYQSREAQLELLDQLSDEYRARLKDMTKNPEELEEQLERLDSSLSQQQQNLSATEAEYRALTDQRRDLRKKLEEGRDRRSEIAELLERFKLLDEHYVSDVARLRGIEEGGTLFEVLGQARCPLCGAEPAHHRKDGDCGGNVEAVVAAARSEIAKIVLLRKELAETAHGLQREGASFDKRLPKVAEELQTVSGGLDRLVAPKLGQLRTTYAGLADKRGGVREALVVFRTIQDIDTRRAKLDSNPDQPGSAVSDGDLSTMVAEEFSQQVEIVLKDWDFPDAERVHFDAKSRDLIIAGKARGARGKGLRAITHAGFTIGLLDYCKAKGTPHPGFVILDSPLLAYRAPEGSEDDLRGTDLDERFYDYLTKLPDDRQVIIVENVDPPAIIKARVQVEMFSGNPHTGRYGFFPLVLKEVHRDLPIDTRVAVQAVRDYNADSYRGRRNTELDREAYDRFRDGLSNNLQQLIDQIAFVGDQYGGVQDRFLAHDIGAEASLISRNLHPVIGQWLKAVTDAKPLIDEVPDESTTAFLFSAFTATKQWGVWASKTLHFLRPDVFPILDSRARKALGLNLGSSSRDYDRFTSCFRDVLLLNSEALAAARVADAGESPTDVKLLDKILFQIGSRMK